MNIYDKEFKVEVKGTTADGTIVLASPAELRLLQSNEVILAVVHSINFLPDETAYRNKLVIYEETGNELATSTVQAKALQ